MRYVVGFSVSVAVGLAPYLGRVRVPLFSPMLSLIPASLQDIALPLSSAAMGIVAVLVQWYGAHRHTPKRLHRWFVTIVITCIAMLVALAAIEMLCVVRIEVPAANQTAAFAV